MIYGVMGECIPSWTSRLSLKALLVVCRLGCGVQRVGAVDPAYECGQPSQGQVITRRTRAAITELRLSFKDGGMLVPQHVPLCNMHAAPKAMQTWLYGRHIQSSSYAPLSRACKLLST